MRLPGRLRAPISIRCGPPTTTAITSPTSSPLGRDQHYVGITRDQFPPGPEWRRADRPCSDADDGDRVEWLDQSDRDWQQFLSLRQHRRGPLAEIRRRGLCAGEFGAWTPIGAEKTATGYEVAWKVTGTDQYTVWTTDNNGNYISNIIGVVSGTQHCVGINRDQFPPGPEWRRADRGCPEREFRRPDADGNRGCNNLDRRTERCSQWRCRGRHVRVPGKLWIEHGQQLHAGNGCAAIQPVDVRNCGGRAKRCPAGRIQCGHHTRSAERGDATQYAALQSARIRYPYRLRPL